MTRVCKQCGEAKTLKSYRMYYNGGASHYKVCKDCERINSRRKYLLNKTYKCKKEIEELELIEKLFDTLRKNGLQPPTPRSAASVTDVVNNLLASANAKQAELGTWLTKDLSTYKPSDLDTVYDELCKQYRPQIGVDPKTFLPIYDESCKSVLHDILVRFDDYEEEYNEME